MNIIKHNKIIICLGLFLIPFATFAAAPQHLDLFEQLRAAQQKNKTKTDKSTEQEIPDSMLTPPSTEQTLNENERPQKSEAPISVPTPPEQNIETDTPLITDSESVPEAKKEESTTEKPTKFSPTSKISGRTQFDFRQHQQTINEEDPPLKNTIFSIRRARVDFRGEITPDISYKSSIELADTIKAKDIYMDLKINDRMSLRGGQFSYPFGNENISSSRYYEFLETSILSNTLSSNRDRGIMLNGRNESKNIFYGVGAVSGTGSKTPDQNSGIDIIADTAALAYEDEGQQISLWLGGSFSTGTQQSSITNSLEILPETESGFTLFSTDLPNDSSYKRLRYAIDVKLVYDSFFVGGEYLNADYTYTTKASVKGSYIMASYFLTGEQRTIERDELEKQKILKPYSSDGGWGAWEVAVRYDQFKLSDNFFIADGLFEGWEAVDDTKNARQGTAITYGVNWYPNKLTRVMLNWVQTTTKSLDEESSAYVVLKTEKALLLRGQIEF